LPPRNPQRPDLGTGDHRRRRRSRPGSLVPSRKVPRSRRRVPGTAPRPKHHPGKSDESRLIRASRGPRFAIDTTNLITLHWVSRAVSPCGTREPQRRRSRSRSSSLSTLLNNADYAVTN
jgi:hypothetical protein